MPGKMWDDFVLHITGFSCCGWSYSMLVKETLGDRCSHTYRLPISSYRQNHFSSTHIKYVSLAPIRSRWEYRPSSYIQMYVMFCCVSFVVAQSIYWSIRMIHLLLNFTITSRTPIVQASLTHCELVITYVAIKLRYLLVTITACCLAEPSHYLNQCW